MKKGLIFLLVLIFVGGLGALLYWVVMTPSALQVVNLALKKEGKVYVFSQMDPDDVQEMIASQKSPPASRFLHLLVKKELYLQPRYLGEIVHLLSGNYLLFDYSEKSFDGYITTNEQDLVQSDMETQTTEKVGEQLLVSTVDLRHDSKPSKRISWSQVSMSTKLKAIENCELKSFMIVSSPYPGTTVGANEKMIVVKLQDLINYYNPDLSLEYNRDEQLLYIIEDKAQ